MWMWMAIPKLLMKPVKLRTSPTRCARAILPLMWLAARGLLVLGVTSLVAAACSSSGSTFNSSLTGTWCSAVSAASSEFVFADGASCQYLLPVQSCGGNQACTWCTTGCSYHVNGNTLSLTAIPSADASADAGAVSEACSYTFTLSNAGNTLEVKGDGGHPTCPNYDVTLLRSSPGDCGFGCGSG